MDIQSILVFFATGEVGQKISIERLITVLRGVTIGDRNVFAVPMVDAAKNIFPPLHKRVGLMKQFVRGLDGVGDCFKYVDTPFSTSIDENMKAS